MKQENEFALEEQLVIISIPTIKKLLSYKKVGSDALLLYNFYYYTAKWQKTNQPKATPYFCMKGLCWGRDRFRKADKLLRELNLIQKIPSKDKEGKITGWYVRINYIWTTEKERKISPEGTISRRVENPPCGKQTINASSVGNLNASSVNNNMQSKALQVSDDEIQRIAHKKQIDYLIGLFKEVNPTYERLFGNKTQRAAMERLVKKFGKEKVERMIKGLKGIFGKPYAPTITTPYLLEKKLADYISYLKKRSEEKINLIDVSKL